MENCRQPCSKKATNSIFYDHKGGCEQSDVPAKYSFDFAKEHFFHVVAMFSKH